MDEKRLPSPLDEALAQVDPDRRKFLGMLLAGVAAAPLLTSVALAAGQKKTAEDKQSAQKADTRIKSGQEIKLDHKADTWVKGGQAIKGESDKSHAIGSKSDIKFSDKTSGSKSQTIKSGQASHIKGENTYIKGENQEYKGLSKTGGGTSRQPIK
jgi:hypothetical protein